MDIRALAEQYAPYIIERRRYYHQHPELSFKEVETTKSLVEDVKAMGLEVQTFPDYTGLIATLDTGRPGKTVMLGAADTFRAAAVEQLQLWADRVGVPIVQQGMNADPASVAYDTLQSALSKGIDIVLIDTAGRLHNKVGLMNELGKIKKVMQKLMPDAPHEILLVLDASTGQNAIEQARQFTAATDVNALALTKLDGTAKGGVIIGISDQFQIPVRYIGLGEKMTDLQVFNADEFVDSLFSH